MTNKKNIIKINRKELSSQQVQEKENLDGLIDTHRKITKRPVYKQKKFYFFLFLVLIITYLIYVSDKKAATIKRTNTAQPN